ncbi:type II CRISPR RNA-guided endonuclease Cas9 [Apibacter muscae]|uniref:type II CRISPR RNA-guided endonuclease Cas9 n=1 Tax=Apibacter muscae TaxID=2509004 RepID=UPI0011AC9A1C|nr:type II CRISPR RNA-guided endonuclease Cas9 [Apibacter muscae]TWP22826.1 type II CRISPR RNA-guided endonuclease Cas9 [Apibacter muscae]
MKHILGLDLGTTSIGWALIKEAEDANEKSSIVKVGVRVNPLTVDEQTNFEKGKPITTNAVRAQARSARRNLQRYKLRRENLIQLLIENHFIDSSTILAENGKNTTFQICELRAKAAQEVLSLTDFARVLLAINKKRGYKSSRKVNTTEDGQLIDGMEIAKKLYEDHLTPGQYVYQNSLHKNFSIPEFYRSDLENEFLRVWEFQKQFYSDILTDELKENIKDKNKSQTWAILKEPLQLVGIKRDKKGKELRLENYQWRNEALVQQLNLETLAIVLQEINGQIAGSSGYLGAISDRSKELYFNKQTVGQYLYSQLQKNKHARLRGQVFYRQDYLDEFEKIWEVQAQQHQELTSELKEKIRDVIIFYQRKLKSKKNLISLCEFEQREIKDKNGKARTVGLRVAPKSSPLFQEVKIWQQLHNVKIKHKKTGEELDLCQEDKNLLFEELNLKGCMSAEQVLNILGKGKEYKLNYKVLEGNLTNEQLYNKYLDILDLSGYDLRKNFKVSTGKEEVNLKDIKLDAHEIKNTVQAIFEDLGINTEILNFHSEWEGEQFQKQPAYQLWHLLYSYNEDDIPPEIKKESRTGMEYLYVQLHKKFGFTLEQAKRLGTVVFKDDYGSLSTKALKKISVYIKENDYAQACALAGYRHSKNSLTQEELAHRKLKDRLENLPKNSLRNPVVEKILNQMVNVVNTLLDSENDRLEAQGQERNFKLDEIRIELARELKKNAKEREELSKQVESAHKYHQKIIEILQQAPFHIKNPSRNDIIRYKLYQELKINGYKDLYTNQYIEPQHLFSNLYDIDHILPKALLFDDSFSNKTLSPKKINRDKSASTAYDYILNHQGPQGLEDFIARVENLYKAKEGGITEAKYKKLLKKATEIGDGFIERDLRDTQYIAKKAKDLLFQITPTVVSTTGSVTQKLREDWGLLNVMKELNLPKYRQAGLTEIIDNKKGEQIIDWTKRNDHRHHAMDALTVAFTKPSHIQYLNYKNARSNENHPFHPIITAIEDKELIKVKSKSGKNKSLFKEPLPNFRQQAREHLETVLISHKNKNKVVTKNKNKIAGNSKIQDTLTPRGQMHKETIYGKIKQYVYKEYKINASFDEPTILKICNSLHRNLLLKRLKENNNDPKKAFTGKNSLRKNPIYLDDEKKETLPDKVKLREIVERFTIRKNVDPDLNIDKVLDEGIKRILKQRLLDYGNNPKVAFSNLDENPIWLNKKKNKALRRVTIFGVINAEPLHTKKDHLGKEILNEKGHPIPVDYISTGNNHHVAIYRDEKGNLQEKVVSFMEAVERKNQNLPVIDKTYQQNLGWTFLFTLKQNEMFVFPSEDFHPAEINLLDKKNYQLISKHLFRVQKIATKDYFFRHHLETNVETHAKTKDLTWKRVRLSEIENIVKVRINHLGEIVQIGEY